MGPKLEWLHPRVGGCQFHVDVSFIYDHNETRYILPKKLTIIKLKETRMGSAKDLSNIVATQLKLYLIVVIYNRQ